MTTLENALKYLIGLGGIGYLLNSHLYNALNDLCKYEKPAFRFIIKSMVRENVISSFVKTNRMKDLHKISYQFASKTGLQQKDIEHILLTIKNAIDEHLNSRRNLLETPNDSVACWLPDEYGCIYDECNCKLLKARTTNSKHYGICVIKEGTKEICKNAFLRVRCNELIIPQSVNLIGDNALKHFYRNIENNSPFFILKEGILYNKTEDRIISCINSKCSYVIDVKPTIRHIDENAFITNSAWAYDYPPYVIKINKGDINYFNANYALIVVPSEEIKVQLKEKGFDCEKIIVGDIYIDKGCVVYTSDKKILLSFPKESDLTSYIILDECEELAEDAFNWLPDPDGECMHIIGNNLRTIQLPPKLKTIGKNALQGLTHLKEIYYYHKSEESNILKLLKDYKDYYVENICNRVKVKSINLD